MTLYLDTSSLIKLYVEESDSDRVQRLVQAADVVVTSTLSYPEARATLARRRRERLSTATEAASARRQLDADWARFVVVGCGHEVARAAGDLAEAHGLRGADAVHLAAFADLLAHSPDDDIRFSSADARLNRAARALG